MNRIVLATALVAVAGVPTMADITVNVAPGVTEKSFTVEMRNIEDMVKPRMERPDAVMTDYTVTDGKFTIKTGDKNARYVIPMEDHSYIAIYTKPGEELTVDLTSTSPLAYSVKGSKLMEDVSALDKNASAIMEEYRKLTEGGSPTPQSIEAVRTKYNKLFSDHVATNKDAESMGYAMLQLDGEDFMNAYATMSDTAKAGMLMPLVEQQKKYVEKSIAMEKRKAELQCGKVTAPDFTYKNLEGKDVSLSDFRGKWVVIDFWGSWCPWCIKGFPKLKEAYAQYKPALEVVGVACNDRPEAWKKALEKYELPWVNVYNPEVNGGKILEEYAVEGFPTKVIVNPKGIIMNITAGEDPEFFDKLSELIKK